MQIDEKLSILSFEITFNLAENRHKKSVELSILSFEITSFKLSKVSLSVPYPLSILSFEITAAGTIVIRFTVDTFQFSLSRSHKGWWCFEQDTGFGAFNSLFRDH